MVVERWPESTADLDRLECDLLVVGAGMAGLTAGAVAATGGRSVVVIDCAPEIGGSAVLSGGVLWTSRDLAVLRADDPSGSEVVGPLLVEGYAALIEWVRSLDVHVGEAVDVLHGRGRRIDIWAYVRACARRVDAAGGLVLTERRVDRLVTSGGRARGAVVSDRDGSVWVKSDDTVLATGGFQASSELLATHMGEERARRLLVRSNPYSNGAGLRFGLAQGGLLSPVMDAFYGHLVAGPTPRFGPEDFGRLAAVYSEKAVLLGSDGCRFIDESRGDHHSVQAVANSQQGRALLVLNEALRHEISDRPNVAGGESVDRITEAVASGAPVGCAESWDGLASEAERLGYDGAVAVAELRDYNESVKTGRSPRSAPRRWHRRPLDHGPWHLVALVPAITFTEGGLQIDVSGRVLGPDGPIPGLFAAGADAGGIFAGGYSGGLCLAGVTGMTSVRHLL